MMRFENFKVLMNYLEEVLVKIKFKVVQLGFKLKSVISLKHWNFGLSLITYKLARLQKPLPSPPGSCLDARWYPAVPVIA